MSVERSESIITRDRAGHDYRSLLVHVEPGLVASHRVELAAGLARRFHARLIGLGAEALKPVISADAFSGQLVVEVYQQLQNQVEIELKAAETAFLRDAAGGDIEWRIEHADPSQAMARAARAADLIVTTADEARSGDVFTRLEVGEIVLISGRPVLVGPAGHGHLAGEKILVAWKDTREARRAVADAMPFLVRAQGVLVHGVCTPDEVETTRVAVDDVAKALRRHGVAATAKVSTAPNDRKVAAELNASAAAFGADLIVAGAYGHSRMMERVLGGVTRSLLTDPERYLLLSH